MELTNYEILQNIDALQKYAKKNYPQKIMFGIAGIIIILNDALKPYRECLSNIMQSYEKDFIRDENNVIKMSENGLPVIQDDVKNEFYKRIDDLLGIKVEVVNKYSVDFESFNYENDQYDGMTGEDIIILSKMLCSE